MLKMKCFFQILSDRVVTLQVSLTFGKRALDLASYEAVVDPTD